MKEKETNTDWKQLSEYYSIQIEGWHLFYQSFIEYENVLSVSKGVLVEMYSEIAKAKIKGNRRTENAEKRVNILFEGIKKMEAMNNRCMNLQSKLKSVCARELDLELENKKLKSELEAIKKSYDEQDT